MAIDDIKENISSRSSEIFDNLVQAQGDRPYEETGFRRIDGPWSWIMSVLLLMSSLFTYGCASTYGILFPKILKDLKSTRALTGFIADVSGSYNNAFYTAGSLEVFAGCLYILTRCIPSSNREVILDDTLDTQLVVVEKETVL
ncbi:hypothetical protein AC249_AIPGENE8816 [Exaiptasia diaphana]|nr:hypothetical protein AC249_AIPGENE8816 [Exaiptasia diaphana]